jgi:hypothetical protein
MVRTSWPPPGPISVQRRDAFPQQGPREFDGRVRPSMTSAPTALPTLSRQAASGANSPPEQCAVVTGTVNLVLQGPPGVC